MGTNTENKRERDFKNLSKFQEVRYNAILDANKEKSVRLKPITDYYSDRRTRIHDIYEFGENNEFVIVKMDNPFKDDGGDFFYEIYVEGKKVLDGGTFTYDHAVLCAVSAKYDGGRGTAGYYLANAIKAPVE